MFWDFFPPKKLIFGSQVFFLAGIWFYIFMDPKMHPSNTKIMFVSFAVPLVKAQILTDGNSSCVTFSYLPQNPPENEGLGTYKSHRLEEIRKIESFFKPPIFWVPAVKFPGCT